MLFEQLAQTSLEVAALAGRKKKIERLATLLAQLAPDERAIGARLVAGIVPQKLGIGHATVGELQGMVTAATTAELSIVEVDRRFTELAALSGSGAGRARKDQFGALLAKATAIEQRFLGALITGGLRQGAEDAIVIDAIAKLAVLPALAVRTAYMFAGDVGVVAAAALGEGAPGLARFGLQLFRPILPMLAQTADDAAAALASFAGPAALELKLDGFRVQLHKDADDVRAFSRGLNDVSVQVPELITAVRALPVRRIVLDGEAIALGPGGRPLPFQDTMQRFGRTAATATNRAMEIDVPLSLAAFDLLLVDDQTLLGEPASARFAALGELAPAYAVSRFVTADAAAAIAFYDDAVARGHEGVMAKALDSPYDAGNRGAAWLKIKRVLRLDLVVLAAEWGSGRRKGWLSNLHLGARDGDGFVMLTKTFKGMTDAMLTWQTAELLAREVDRDGHIVYVRPELVVETAFNDVQRSSQYPAGLTLRHARIVRYRDDKTAAEADTIDAVRALAIAGGVLAV